MNGESTMQGAVIDGAVRTAPPLAVTSFSVAGLPVNEWVYILTAIYITFQIIVIAPKAWRILRGKNERRE